MEIIDSYLYVADHDDGIKIFDISDLQSIKILSRINVQAA